jgi:hypothetical protein
MLVVAQLFFLSGCENRYENLNIAVYQYRDTKNLVKFVYDAAQILRKEGLKGLDYFRANRTRYLTSDYYLYSWWEPGKFYPVPKSSCHFKVSTPEGKVFLVGGGLNYPLEEKEFIRIAVDDAAQLIREQGESALAVIENPASSFNFRDVKVFVFTSAGKLLISPVMNDRLANINLLDCVDEMGHKPFRKALHELKTKDLTWEVFLARDRYQRSLIKKSLYLRKIDWSGQELYVGAITDLPQPPA